MKALVTGAAGFIGSHFVEMALSGEIEGIEQIVIVDKLTYAANIDFLNSIIDNKRVKFHQLDINDKQEISKLMPGVDYLINFAAESHVDNSIKSADEFIRTNVQGVQSLLDVSLDSGITKFLQVSTDEVYGSIETGTWTEESPLLPNSPYSASKAAADLLCRAYFQTHKVPVVITRCSNNFGPRQHSEKLIPTIIQKIKTNSPIPIYGDGLNVRDWLYVSDHIRGINKCIKKGMSGEIYNIGGGKELPNIELVSKICENLKIQNPNLEYVTDRKGHDRRYSLSFEKIKNIGYEPIADFELSLSKTINYFLV